MIRTTARRILEDWQEALHQVDLAGVLALGYEPALSTIG